VNKHPVKQVINYLDLTPDEFEEFSSPPSISELSISKAQARPLFKPHEDVQDPNTLHVPYELFVKLPQMQTLLIIFSLWLVSGRLACNSLSIIN